MTKTLNVPFYLKMSQIMIGMVAFFFILYIGQDIIVPLIYALVIAVLLNPAVDYLIKRKVNVILAISIVMLAAIVVLGGLIYFISAQIANFADAFPMMKQKLDMLFNDSVKFVSQTFNISSYKIHQWAEKTKSEGLGNSSALIGQTLGTLGGFIAVLTLIPVYIFMFIYYKPLLLNFLSMLSPEGQQGKVKEVLNESRLLIQSYLMGLVVETGIVAVLNSVGLLALGIDYAILLGIIGAILNIIPYVGGIVAAGLSMLIALATKSPTYALLVLGVYLVVQFIDNNYIMTKIVASRVKINALVSVIIVIIGGVLWGISGMFLSIPLIAIVKVIFDRIEPLKPWGYLLGDTMPRAGTKFFSARKPKTKTVIDP